MHRISIYFIRCRVNMPQWSKKTIFTTKNSKCLTYQPSRTSESWDRNNLLGVQRQAFHTTSKLREILHFHPHGKQAYTEIVELYSTVNSLLNQESLGEGWWHQTTLTMLRKQFLFTLTVDVPYLASHWRLSRAWMLQGSERFKVDSIHLYPVRYLFKVFLFYMGCSCVSLCPCVCVCVSVCICICSCICTCVCKCPWRAEEKSQVPWN